MFNKIFFLSTLFSFCIVHFALSQKPDWVENQGKSAQFPEQIYLTGFGMQKVEDEDKRDEIAQQAYSDARGDLSQKIRVQIQNIFLSKNEETNREGFSYISNVVQASSDIELIGLEAERYYDDDDEMCYALARVRRDLLASTYGKKADEARDEIRLHMANGKEYEDAGDRAMALDEYLLSLTLFGKLKEAETVLLVIPTIKSDAEKAFAELDAIVEKEEVTINQVRQAIQRLMEKPIASVEDLAWILVYGLNKQVDLRNKSVLIAPFTYQDTKMGSPFSRYFHQVLETKGTGIGQWKIKQQGNEFRPQSRDAARDYFLASGAEYVLIGTYWQLPDTLIFQAEIKQVSNSAPIARIEAAVPLELINRTGFSITPQNFKEALSDQQAFRREEVVDGGLRLEVWTNKGTENLLYTTDERMVVYVRVNTPCNIRFVYHLADGKRALLEDNYPIAGHMVNVPVQIPDTFFCAPPYGAEVLQVFARTDQFEKVETVLWDDYDILKEDLPEFLATTRGMKKVKKGTLQTEKRLVITTMER